MAPERDFGAPTQAAPGATVPNGPDWRPAVGAQEVIIETPRHDGDPARLPAEDLRALVEGYHTRYVAMAQADTSQHIILFRNRGAEAGNSLVHPHAQLYALEGPVPEIDWRHGRARALWLERGACPLCALEELEPSFEARVVARNRWFRAVVPWAAMTTMEIWIVPRAHQASFGQCTAEQREALGDMLGHVLRALRAAGGDPAYNALWHGARMAEATAEHLHWHIQIRPRIARPAGFELASGVDVCPSDPLSDAEALRSAAQVNEPDGPPGGTPPR